MRKITFFSALVTAFWVGVIVHDIASIIGLHVPGWHAIYYAIPFAIASATIYWFEVRKR